MPATRSFYLTLLCGFLACALPARAATINATWNTASDVPVTAASYTATGNTVNFMLNFAPATGTNLTVVNNTGLPFISGTFSNLAQGQAVALSYGGVTYNYVAHYYGGTGNDLVLVWANSRAFGWGANSYGQIGDGTTSQRGVMVPVMTTGVLAGKTLVAVAQGIYHSLALCADGTVAAWGANYNGQLGNNSTTESHVPVLVNTASGVSALYGKTVVAVAAGSSHSMALCSDGTVATWGYNGDGELGNNSTTQRSVPVAVNTASGVSALFGKTVVNIAAGADHSLALCSDGTVAAWGYNVYGHLGDNTTTQRTVPVAVNTTNGISALNGKTVMNVAAGNQHSMALCSDGTVAAWGKNIYGQIGDNSTTQRNAPVKANVASGVSALFGKTVTALSAGNNYSLALCSDGTVAAWGYNFYGQLGDNTTTQRSVPVAVSTAGGVSALSGKTVVSIVTGGSYDYCSGALCADGSMATWGYNSAGDLGNNSSTSSPVPVVVNTSPLAPGERLILSSRGAAMALPLVLVADPTPALTTLPATTIASANATVNGTVNANNGAAVAVFEYGTTTAYGSSIATTPATVTGGTDTAVSAVLTGLTPQTTYHYRIRTAGATGTDQTFTTLNNNASLAGLTTSVGSLSPVFAPGTTQYSITPGSMTYSLVLTPTAADSNAAVTVNGTAVAYGSTSGAISLGYGDSTIAILVTAQDGVTKQLYTVIVKQGIPGGPLPAAYTSSAFVPVSSSGFTATGRAVNLTLNFAPATGTNLTVVNNTGLPFINGRFSNLAQGQAVALSYNGVTYNYVANYYGGTGNDLVLVWANNRAFAWGTNVYGRTGNGTYNNSSVMVPVTATGVLAGKTILAVSQSNYHSLALCSDGTVAAWGNNNYGQLGDNSTSNSLVPLAVSTASGVSALNGKTVVAVSAGYYHSLALCSDGTVVTWGYNSSGQLGTNTTTESHLPVAVSTTYGVSALHGKTVVAIAAGYYYNLALCSDGTLVSWGYNNYGELGDNTLTQRNVPVTVNTASGVSALYGKTVVAATAGYHHSMALCSDGTLAAWGNNGYGGLGDNTTTQRNAPVAVNTASGVSALNGKTVVNIAAGYDHSLALCSDGSVTAWGYNYYGQLGNNTTTESHVPLAVSTTGGISALAGKTVVAIGAAATANYASTALCSDSTMATWGYNNNGDLGNGSTTNSLVPAAVNTSPLVAGERLTSPSGSRSIPASMAVVAEPSDGATTLAATVVSGSSAVLNGVVSSFNGSVNVSFDFGTSTSYGGSIAATPAVVSGGNATAVTATVTSLQPLTTYHFRVNAGGHLGSDQTFTTPNNEAGLAALTTSAGGLSPTFASATTDYTAPNVPGTTSSISVTPTLTDANDTLTMTANGLAVGVASGSPSTVSLGYGDNVIRMMVRAEDGATTRNYTLTVKRPLPVALAAAYASGSDVPLTSNASIYPAGSTVNFTLNYAPVTGASLMVVNNTGRSFIHGTFDNLAQGQAVALSYNGVTYHFVANYYGGTGNDLVLVWANNRMLAWGFNTTGMLGDGTTNNRKMPAAVSSAGVLAGKTIIATATGDYHALALCSDGTVAAWGLNSNGQLGDNSTTQRNVPVAVNTSSGVSALYGKTVVAISAGEYHSLALCSDGTVAAWGYNYDGELGSSDGSYYSTLPVAVNTSSGVSALYGKTVVAIAAGNYFSLALCDDGTVATWGENGYGNLGNNSTTSSKVPTAVSTASGVSALYGKTVVAIAAGSSHALALCSDGSLAAWGSGSSGQLGNSSTTSTNSVPVAVSTASGVSALYGKTVTALAANGSHNLVLCADGTLAAWGDNTYGDLGNNSSSSSNVPVAVNTASGVSALYGKTVVAVAAGLYHCMALCSDGSLAAWGDNAYGDLGNNSAASSKVPTLVSSGALAAGEQWSALMGGGNAYYWSLAVASVPAYATLATQAATATGSGSSTLNGIVVAAYDSMAVSFEYGTNTSYGSTTAATPTPVSTGAATQVSAVITGLAPLTNYHFRVKGSNGAATLTGSDLTFTTLNNNASLASLTVSSGTLSPAFSSSTTSYSLNVPFATAAITFAATLADANASMQINGAPISSGTFNLTEGSSTLSILVTAQDGSTTQTYTLAVNRAAGPSLGSLGLDSGTLSPAFDSNVTSYLVNVSSSTSTLVLTPAVVNGTTTVKVNGTAVASGSASNPVSLVYGDNVITTAVTSQDGSTTKTYSLRVTRGIPASFSASFASAGTVPLTTNGLTASGSTVNLTLNYAPVAGTRLTVVNNTSSGFINGTFGNLAQGQLVALSYNGISYHFVASYFGGTGNDLVLLWADARPFAWGSNSDNQLGNPATYFGTGNIPAAVVTSGALSQKIITSFAAGHSHSLALCSDGTVGAWGFSFYGALGTGFFGNYSPTPLLVNTSPAGTQETFWGPSALYGKSVVAISAGSVHSIALCSDGTVASWGDNSYGQLGTDDFLSFIQNEVPVAVSTEDGVSALAGKTVVAISAGTNHNLALCSDGTIAGWGNNGSGQLGNLSVGIVMFPQLVNTANGASALSGKTVVAISAGGSHSLALCSDGTVAAWGSNASGQLGDNTTTDRVAPVAVNTAIGVSALYGKTVVAISAGGFHSMALCSDGTVVSWGQNAVGQMGDNSTTQRLVPVAVNKASGVSALFGKTVTGISAGNGHSLARCSDGTVAAWGYNGDGETGADSNVYSQLTPFAVPRTNLATAEFFTLATAGPNSSHSLALVATPPATATSLAASAVTGSNVTLNGTVNASNGYVPVSFDIGLTTAYGTSVPGAPASATGSTAQSTSVTLTGLLPATTYHFRVNGGTYSGSDLTFTTLSSLQDWRQTYFGTLVNTGVLADTADFDSDGIPNLLEWACNLDPLANGAAPFATVRNGANIEFTYSRSTTAANSGAAFTVEWSNTLAAGSWSSTGVTQTVLSDDGTTQQVKAVIPVNAANAKFARLSVTAPP